MFGNEACRVYTKSRLLPPQVVCLNTRLGSPFKISNLEILKGEKNVDLLPNVLINFSPPVL